MREALETAADGNNKIAEQLLQNLHENITALQGKNWCDHPIINAVLLEKAADCEIKDICLEVKIDFNIKQSADVGTLQLGVQPIHICSVFSNLLDNAIQAASLCPKSQRKISIHALYDGNFFHVKVKNSALKSDKENKRSGHGYGQRILRDIAEQYHGAFYTKWEGSLYTAAISLECEEVDGNDLQHT